MVNRNLKQIATEIGSKEPPGRLKLRSRFAGHEYVPSLKLYVKDETTYQGWSFKRCRELLEKNNASMLSPPEFWEYYDHCKEKRPDIIEKLKTNKGHEYLDAIFNVDESLLVIKPELLKTKNVGLVKRTQNYIFPGPDDLRYFSRKYVNKRYGYPYTFESKNAEFCMFGGEQAWVNLPCILTSKSNKIALGLYNLSFDGRPDVVDIRGVRPCYTEGVLKKMFSKGKQ